MQTVFIFVPMFQHFTFAVVVFNYYNVLLNESFAFSGLPGARSQKTAVCCEIR